MSNKYKDFDEHFAEKRGQTLDFMLRGREYSLPVSPSFDVVLEVERMIRGMDLNEEVKGGRMERMCRKLFGEEYFEQMKEDGVTLEELEAVLKWVWEIYNSSAKKDEGGSGNLTSTSSKTGSLSKQTSKENTA